MTNVINFNVSGPMTSRKDELSKLYMKTITLLAETEALCDKVNAELEAFPSHLKGCQLHEDAMNLAAVYDELVMYLDHYTEALAGLIDMEAQN